MVILEAAQLRKQYGPGDQPVHAQAGVGSALQRGDVLFLSDGSISRDIILDAEQGISQRLRTAIDIV